MAEECTIVCPHCGKTDNYRLYIGTEGSSNHGTTSTNCKRCHKTIHLHWKGDKITRVDD